MIQFNNEINWYDTFQRLSGMLCLTQGVLPYSSIPLTIFSLEVIIDIMDEIKFGLIMWIFKHMIIASYRKVMAQD